MVNGVQRGLAHGPGHVGRVEESHHGRQDQVDVVVQGGTEVLQGGQHLVRDLAVPAGVVGEHAQDVRNQLGQVHLVNRKVAEYLYCRPNNQSTTLAKFGIYTGRAYQNWKIVKAKNYIPVPHLSISRYQNT